MTAAERVRLSAALRAFARAELERARAQAELVEAAVAALGGPADGAELSATSGTPPSPAQASPRPPKSPRPEVVPSEMTRARARRSIRRLGLGPIKK